MRRLAVEYVKNHRYIKKTKTTLTATYKYTISYIITH